MPIETDLFGEWINVPDDLPPVDEDGLNDLASFGHQVDQFMDHSRYEPSSGLLLAHPNAPQVVETFDPINNSVQVTSDPSPSYANLCPPLSPDCSPYSITSSPWLRTPLTDPSPANIANLAPANGVWDVGAEETRAIHFVDRSGISLEDVPLQVHDVMLEDIICSPQTSIYDNSPHTPSVVISPPLPVSSLQQPDDFLPPTSPHWQSFLMYSPMNQESLLHSHPASPSLSPLSTLSILSQSPSSSPHYLPPVDHSSTSSTLSSHVPISDSDIRVGVTSRVPSSLRRMTSANWQGKRHTSVVDEDDPNFSGTPRRSKAKNRDDEEWNPTSGRVKRPRVAGPSQSTSESPSFDPSGLLDEDEPKEGLEGTPEATNTCCEYCGQRFTRASDRIRHMENSANHPETRKMWPCRYCDSMLGRKDALVRHIRTLHPGAPLLIQTEGVLESHLPGTQDSETFVRRMGQRKLPLRRLPRRDARTRNR